MEYTFPFWYVWFGGVSFMNLPLTKIQTFVTPLLETPRIPIDVLPHPPKHKLQHALRHEANPFVGQVFRSLL